MRAFSTVCISCFLGLDQLDANDSPDLLREFIALRLARYLIEIYGRFDVKLNASGLVRSGTEVVINPAIESFIMFQLSITNATESWGDIGILVAPELMEKAS